MSELKAINLNSMGCYNINEPIYLKSEADKVISRHKYKRCLGIAAVCFEKSYSTTLVKYDKESDLFRNFYDWWGKYWLKLAEKFKPNNSTDQ